MLTEALLLLVLILVNGAFALSEIAIVSARRARLHQLADAGEAGARRALDLAAEPTRFLSTVQVGITTIGILSGAIGQAAIGGPLRAALESVPALAPHAEALSLVIVVVGLTYVSLILGELVPKRLALTRPEAMAMAVAGPMRFASRVMAPIVHLLSASTDAVLTLLRIPKVKQPAVTLEELKVLIQQGTDEGVFEQNEQEIVTNVLRLDERPAGSILTPRSDVVFLDVQDPPDLNRQKLTDDPHTVLPLCDGSLEHVVGFVRSKGILQQLLRGAQIDFRAAAEPPLFVPHTMTLMMLLEHFKLTHLTIALVVDEYGDVDGLVSLTDVISAIVGDLPGEPGEEPSIVERQDGSWLIDGSIGIEAVQRTIGVDELLGDDDRHYHTLGGLAMLVLGRVPRTGDVFAVGAFRFEVVDMDRKRVDKVLVSRVAAAPDSKAEPES